MNKEYTLTKEVIEYWKEDFRNMACEDNITFKEYITGSAGAGPELDGSLGMWGSGKDVDEFCALPEDEQRKIAKYRYYEVFPSQIAADLGITKEELLNMTADEFAKRF